MLFTTHETISEAEKRNKKPFPELKLTLDSVTAFPKGFNDYFEDHFGFRSDLLFLYNYILVKAFAKSPVEEVVCGRRGWLYYTGDRLLEDFKGEVPFSKKDLDIWTTTLTERRAWLNSRGIDFLFVIAPNKQSVYPEFLPGYIQKFKGKPRVDQLLKAFRAKGFANILDIRPIIMEKKSRGSLYYATGTHWNIEGAYIAYQEIMRQLKTINPGVLLMNRHDLLFNSHDNGRVRDLDAMVGLAYHPIEKQPWPDTVQKGCPEIVQTISLPYVGPNYYEKPFIKCSPDKPLNVVVFRDSFSNALEPFLSQSFGRVVYIWKRYDPVIMEALLGSFQPDLVIEECIERYLLSLPLDRAL